MNRVCDVKLQDVYRLTRLETGLAQRDLRSRIRFIPGMRSFAECGFGSNYQTILEGRGNTRSMSAAAIAMTVRDGEPLRERETEEGS